MHHSSIDFTTIRLDVFTFHYQRVNNERLTISNRLNNRAGNDVT